MLEATNEFGAESNIGVYISTGLSGIWHQKKKLTYTHFHFLVPPTGESGVRLWNQARPLYGFDHDERWRLKVSYL